MRVAFVGSRGFPYGFRHLVEAEIAALPADTVVISGGASGVDTWAEAAAHARGLEVVVMPANWDEHGRAAGPIRNQELVRSSNQVCAYWDLVSPGTRNVLELCRRARKPLRVWGPDGTRRPELEVAEKQPEQRGLF